MNKLVISTVLALMPLFTKSAMAQTVSPEITSWKDCYKYISFPYPAPSEDTTKETVTINGVNLIFSVPSNYQLVEGNSLGYADGNISILPPDSKKANKCIQQTIKTGSELGSSIPQIDSISISVKNEKDVETLVNHSSFRDYKHLQYVSIDGNVGSVGQYIGALGCNYGGVGKIVRIPIEDKFIDIKVSGKCDGPTPTTAVGINYYESLSKIFHQVLGSLKIN